MTVKRLFKRFKGSNTAKIGIAWLGAAMAWACNFATAGPIVTMSPLASPALTSPSPLICPFPPSPTSLVPSPFPSLAFPTSSISPEVAPTAIRTEISSKEVTNGTIAIVKVSLPMNLRRKPVIGEFEGIQLPFYHTSKIADWVYEAVLAVPYETKPGPAVVKIKVGEGAGSTSVEVPFQVVEGAYRSETLKVDGRRVNPTSKKDLARIMADQAQVGEIYRRVTPQKYWTGPFLFPIDSDVTSPFGNKRLFNGKLKNFHTGLDLRAKVGTPIYSSAPGVVVLAKSLFYTGNTVMIDHGYGVVTLYAHMSKLKVRVGEVVQAHQLVGLSGKTGRVTGPHLHWMAIIHKVKVNPLGLTQVMR